MECILPYAHLAMNILASMHGEPWVFSLKQVYFLMELNWIWMAQERGTRDCHQRTQLQAEGKEIQNTKHYTKLSPLPGKHVLQKWIPKTLPQNARTPPNFAPKRSRHGIRRGPNATSRSLLLLLGRRRDDHGEIRWWWNRSSYSSFTGFPMAWTDKKQIKTTDFWMSFYNGDDSRDCSLWLHYGSVSNMFWWTNLRPGGVRFMPHMFAEFDGPMVEYGALQL